MPCRGVLPGTGFSETVAAQAETPMANKGVTRPLGGDAPRDCATTQSTGNVSGG